MRTKVDSIALGDKRKLFDSGEVQDAMMSLDDVTQY